MDTTALRAAYAEFLDAATRSDLGPAADGGWHADQVLAHVLSVDATITAVAHAIIAGARPAFDNRICLDTTNLDRIIADHDGRAGLVDHVRAQAAILCDTADRLTEANANVQVPAFLVSNDEVQVDQPVPLASLITGLADNHVPGHSRQLLDLRVLVAR